jgi:gliding motility-associated-like protein
MRKLIYILLALTGFNLNGQCDISIIDYDYNTGNITIDVIDSENCGCNEFTVNDTECEDSGSNIVGNNENISHLVLGLHIPELDEGWTECVDNTYHDGWTWKVKNFYTNTSLSTEDTWSENIYEFSTFSNDCWDEILDYAQDNELCAELVVWQINLSQTVMVDNGGWAVNPNSGNQTQSYPDVDISNNSFLVCPPPPSPDAIVNNIEIQTGCIGDIPVYNVQYTVVNIGDEPITNYCIEIWNEDYYMCFDSELFGNYEIPPGEGQQFTTQFFEFDENPGGFFVISVDNVNGEIVTGNNNTTVYYPEIEEWEVCPVECENDTITIILPPDTIIVTQIDTVITQEYVYLTDTLIEYVDVYVVDTLIEYITEFVIDTIFIFETDTLTIIETQLIDCETGEDCGDPPGISECWPWTVYIPNTFTPNNDGINDVWKIVYNLDCWVDVEFQIFNRWGNKIYHGYGEDFNSFPFWDGSVNGGDYYASDGVYVYTFYGRKEDSPEVLEESGYITIFR